MAAGKDPASVDVPPFLPDNDTVRRDLLDYAVEVEHFDAHLLRMVEHLDDDRRAGRYPDRRHLRPRDALPAGQGPDL